MIKECSKIFHPKQREWLRQQNAVARNIIPTTWTRYQTKKNLFGEVKFDFVTGTVFFIRSKTHISAAMDSGKPFFVVENAKSVHMTKESFAVLKRNGEVVVWGNPLLGGDLGDINLINVKQIFENDYSFAALTHNGTVYTWGDSNSGGFLTTPLTNVKTIVASKDAYCALKNDGTIFTWGDSENGGDSSRVSVHLYKITKVFASGEAFCVVDENSKVICWGNPDSGGSFEEDELVHVKTFGNVLVKTIVSTKTSFVILTYDGEVACWGNPEEGGYFSESVEAQLYNVESLQNTETGVAAKRYDGYVISWGKYYGGDFSAINGDLTNVKQIFTMENGFVDLQYDGTVKCWGVVHWEHLEEQLVDIVHIMADNGKFFAFKECGKIIEFPSSFPLHERMAFVEALEERRQARVRRATRERVRSFEERLLVNAFAA